MSKKPTLTPNQKSSVTARWAVTMAKWHIGFHTGGRIVGSRTIRPSRRWNLVTFLGRGGKESRGIVDVLAIRKDHRIPEDPALKRGDLFEMILIQVKGGSAKRPTAADAKRLKKVQKRYGATNVLLATWKRRRELNLSQLNLRTEEWDVLDNPRKIFR